MSLPFTSRRDYLMLFAAAVGFPAERAQAQGLLSGLPNGTDSPDAVRNWAELSARFNQQGPPVSSKKVAISVAEYALPGALEIGIGCPEDGVEMLALFARPQKLFTPEKLESADKAFALFTFAPRLIPQVVASYAFTSTTRFFGVAVVNGAIWTAEKEVKLLHTKRQPLVSTAA